MAYVRRRRRNEFVLSSVIPPVGAGNALIQTDGEFNALVQTGGENALIQTGSAL